jgi:hypothetical protein
VVPITINPLVLKKLLARIRKRQQPLNNKGKRQIVVGLYKFRIKPVNTKLQKTAAILVLLLLKVLLQF